MSIPRSGAGRGGPELVGKHLPFADPHGSQLPETSSPDAVHSDSEDVNDM